MREDSTSTECGAGSGRYRCRCRRRERQPPGATPLVSEEAVFTAGVTGKLVALERESGRKLWERELLSELGGTVVYRGYSSSPIAYGNTVIVPVGGEGRAVMAFRMQDGAAVWSAGDFENTNASPLLVELGGRMMVVVFMANVVAGLDAATGHLLFQHAAAQRFHDNISTPVFGRDGLLFCSSYADGGSRVLRLRATEAGVLVEELWQHTEMRLYYTNAVRIGDFIFGSSGDLGPTFFTAVDVRTGEIAWRSRALARSNFILADGTLYLRDEEGRLSAATVSADGVEVRGEAPLFEPGPPTPPTLSEGRLYARDRERIAAFDLREEGAGR